YLAGVGKWRIDFLCDFRNTQPGAINTFNINEDDSPKGILACFREHIGQLLATNYEILGEGTTRASGMTRRTCLLSSSDFPSAAARPSFNFSRTIVHSLVNRSASVR